MTQRLILNITETVRHINGMMGKDFPDIVVDEETIIKQL